MAFPKAGYRFSNLAHKSKACGCQGLYLYRPTLSIRVHTRRQELVELDVAGTVGRRNVPRINHGEEIPGKVTIRSTHVLEPFLCRLHESLGHGPQVRAVYQSGTARQLPTIAVRITIQRRKRYTNVWIPCPDSSSDSFDPIGKWFRSALFPNLPPERVSESP